MITSSSSGSILPASPKPTSTYYVNTERDAHSRTALCPQYDSVSISHMPTGDSRCFKDIVSRLSQEVRTATTTGDIQTLRQQVAAGEYRPDPAAIAARIMFLREG